MACFEIGILYTPAANTTISYKEGISTTITYKEDVNITISYKEDTSITVSHKADVISGVSALPQLTKFNISIVCDVDYGIPLYTTDGSVYTIDGVPVYVRRAKVSDYT